MNIEEVVPLTNGLSFSCGRETLVCDRARVTPVRGDAVDVAFLVAGTDYVPRVRLRRDRIARATPDEIARVIRRVACRAIAGAC